ncbi:hypothetical protein PFISCL1PPCAC_3660 [Pristionchus fissidentatus]|uniref:Uncharacterized protein n=1 Tax=Pristionchus fissidentatus TaxID=1538716 RepID=A0AAV5V012_9BILA|nr:hypothetical protein PFISCL1PPCAC_3660 [Pristionchus fissidentatus]
MRSYGRWEQRGETPESRPSHIDECGWPKMMYMTSPSSSLISIGSFLPGSSTFKWTAASAMTSTLDASISICPSSAITNDL